MKREDILELIDGLSNSQGLYGRLLNSLYELSQEDEDYFNLLMSTWEDCKFDHLGFIEFVESEPVDIWSVEDINRWLGERNNKCEKDM